MSVTITAGTGEDLSEEDLARLVQVVASANIALGLRDKQLQRIETRLDLALMELEGREPDEAT